jgi:RNA polymerase sigma-70 factor, ECF subfamily
MHAQSAQPQPHDDLTTRARAADPQALAQIYERYAPAIYRYIYFRIGEHAQAEDLCADVFVAMLEDVGRFEDRGKPISAWLYRIAHARTVDVVRRRQRHPQTPLDTWHGVDDGPEATVAELLLRQDLHHALHDLTPDQRQVLVLRFVHSLSILEVAQQIGRSAHAVKSLQHRALAKLSRRLQRPPTA